MKPENSQQDEVNRLINDLGEEAENLTTGEVDRLIEMMSLGFPDEVEAPEGLREKVLGSASEKAVEKPRDLKPSPARRPVFLPWATAAVFAILATAGWMKFYSKSAKVSETERKLVEVSESIEKLQLEKKDLASVVEAYKSSSTLDQLKIAALESELDESYFGVAVWDADRERGILRVARIPKLDGNEKDYQLWVVDPQYETPVDGGVFQVDAEGRATISFAPGRKITKATAFAVSLEKKGGVPVAEGPMVLVGGL